MRTSTDGIPDEGIPKRRSRWVPFLLVLLPAWLIVSGIGAMWYYFVLEEKQERESQSLFARSVSVPMIEDDLRKILSLIGERNTSSDAAGNSLLRAASMIEGTLGPSNTGYAVRRERGPAEWPLLIVTLEGSSLTAPAVWVVTSYDSRPGSPGAEANASGLAATLAAAQAVAADRPRSSIHFAFIPHANDPLAPVIETTEKISERIGIAAPASVILTVEAMGAADSLVLSSRDASARALHLADGLGEIRQPETVNPENQPELAARLSDRGLSAVRVATRPVLDLDEPDEALPAAATVAASAGRLVELIRRCATAAQ